MEVFKEAQLLRKRLTKHRNNGHSVGLVPTMGSLHKGHLQLIEKCLKQNKVTVCSIFVNPTQFSNPTDLKKYPQNIDKDLTLLELTGCDIVFNPDVKEMYPQPPVVQFDFGQLGNILEGKFRPGHFNGVGFIVSKLFNIVVPDRAYFGEKDLQQLAIMRRLVTDMNYNIEIVGIPTVREQNGLALSSRNKRLTDKEKIQSSIIYKSLKAGEVILRNQGSARDVCNAVAAVLKKATLLNPEYIECIDMDSFKILVKDDITENTAICTAVKIGKVRLIDNLIVRKLRPSRK